MTDTEFSLGEIERLVAGHHRDPHSILGAHPGPEGVVVRALRPVGASVTVVLDDGRRFPMTRLGRGVFTVTLPDEKVPDYRLATVYPGGRADEAVADDPYRYLPMIGEFDLYLIAEGRHEELWRVLGAHVREAGQVTGTSFAVWAPNALGVRVTGDFNYWDGRAFPMRSLGGSGSTPPVTSAIPASRRSPRSRPPGPGCPGRCTWAGWASASSGTWAGCTTRSAT